MRERVRVRIFSCRAEIDIYMGQRKLSLRLSLSLGPRAIAEPRARGGIDNLLANYDIGPAVANLFNCFMKTSCCTVCAVLIQAVRRAGDSRFIAS